MDTILAFVAVSAVCMGKGVPSCATYANSTFNDKEKCKEFVAKNNNYWKAIKLKGQMYCIESSIPPETR